MLHRVLVVEDDDDLRIALAFSLHEAGFEVLTARTSTEAIIRAAGPPLSAVILSLQLAGDDGTTVLRALAAQQETIATPVIALTSRPLPMPQGVTDLVLKPAEVEAIVERVEDLLDAPAEDDDPAKLAVLRS